MTRALVLLLLLIAGCAPGHRAQWREPLEGEVRAMGATRDEKRLFLVVNKTIVMRDAATGRPLAKVDLNGFEPAVLRNTRDRMVALGREKSELLVWKKDRLEEFERKGVGDREAGVKKQEITLPGPDSPEGPSPLTGAGEQDDGTLVVCDARGRTGHWKEGADLVNLIETRGQVAGSGVSPDGSTLVLIDAENLHFYRLPEIEKLGAVPHGRQLKGLQFSPDGAHLAAVMASQVLVVGTRDASVVASLPGVASSVSFSAEGRYFCATNVGSVDVWDLKTGRARGSVNLLSVAQSEVVGSVPHLLTLRQGGVDLWSLDQPEVPIWSYRKPIRVMKTHAEGAWFCTTGGWLESWRLPLDSP